MTVHTRIAEITDSIARRSRDKRSRYLDRIDAAADTAKLPRKRLGCANQAHSFAGCGAADKAALRSGEAPNVAIVTSYNDMLSAHQPYEHFPELIREAAREAG